MWGSGHFNISSLDCVLSSSEKERITCWGHCLNWFPCLGEQYDPCCIDIVSSVHRLYILQTNVSEDCMVSSVRSHMLKPWSSLQSFHDDRFMCFAM